MPWYAISPWGNGDTVSSTKLNQMRYSTEYVRYLSDIRVVLDRLDEMSASTTVSTNTDEQLYLTFNGTQKGTSTTVSKTAGVEGESYSGSSLWANLRDIDISDLNSDDFYTVRMIYTNSYTDINLLLDSYFYKDSDMNYYTLLGNIDAEPIENSIQSLTVSDLRAFVSREQTNW